MNQNLHSGNRGKAGRNPALVTHSYPGSFAARYFQACPAFSVYREKFAQLLQFPPWLLFDSEGGYAFLYTSNRPGKEEKSSAFSLTAMNKTSVFVAPGQLLTRHTRLGLTWHQVNNDFYFMGITTKQQSKSIPYMLNTNPAMRFHRLSPDARENARMGGRSSFTGQVGDIGHAYKISYGAQGDDVFRFGQGQLRTNTDKLNQSKAVHHFPGNSPGFLLAQLVSQKHRRLPVTSSRVKIGRCTYFGRQTEAVSGLMPVRNKNVHQEGNMWRDLQPGEVWRTYVMQARAGIESRHGKANVQIKQSVVDLLSITKKTEIKDSIIHREHQQSIKKLIHTVSELQQVSKYEVNELRRAVSSLADKFERQSYTKTKSAVVPLSFYGRL